MSLSALIRLQQRENVRRQKTLASTIETSVPEFFIKRGTLFLEVLTIGPAMMTSHNIRPGENLIPSVQVHIL